jgi:hypothetical protein
VGWSGDALAELAHHPAEQAGHLHLGDPESLGDLFLRPVVVEAQRNDVAVSRG